MGTHKGAAINRARRLRSNQTDAERKLWSILRNRQFHGLKFVRQQPVGPYIADFACRERDLIVEVDGSQHIESAPDERRTAVLAEHGYEVIRFWNNDVLTNLDGVYRMLEEMLAKAPSPGLRFAKPDLSPRGRGDAGAPSELASGSASAVRTDHLSLGGESLPRTRSGVGAQRRVRGPLGTRGDQH